MKIKNLLKSNRYKHIKKTQKMAKKEGLCKELFEEKCSYPHCSCLFKDFE
jgi:hypothetical protein